MRLLMALWMLLVTLAVYPCYFPSSPDKNSPESVIECEIIKLKGELELKINEVNLKVATLEGRAEALIREDKSISNRIDYLNERMNKD